MIYRSFRKSNTIKLQVSKWCNSAFITNEQTCNFLSLGISINQVASWGGGVHPNDHFITLALLFKSDHKGRGSKYQYSYHVIYGWPLGAVAVVFKLISLHNLSLFPNLKAFERRHTQQLCPEIKSNFNFRFGTLILCTVRGFLILNRLNRLV